MPAKHIWQGFTRFQGTTGKNKMPEIIADNISIVETKELEGAARLDAEYYQPKYLKVKGNLNHFKSLKFYTENIIHPHEIKRIYSGYGETFLLTQNVRPLRLDFSTEVFIKEQDVQKLSRNILKVGDVLITRTGANFGDTAFYYNQRERIFASSHVLIVRPNASIDGLYLAVFLNTKWGRKMLDRGMYGGLQPEIAPSYLKTIPIPRFVLTLEKDISQKVIESLKYENLANSLYSQAETLLLEELGIKDVDLSHEPCYEVNSVDTISANRIDAEYYQPKYERVIEAIKKHPYKSVGDMFRLIKGIEPGSSTYCEEGKPFIRVSNLNKFEINNDNQQYLPEKNYSELKANYQPLKSEILLSKDATPGIAYHLKEPIDGIISSGILRLQALSNIKREYICLVINSIVGQSQSERDSGGSVINHWKPSQVQNTLIPLLPDKIQERIESLCLESHSARRQAKGLLEEAKRKVEEMIEKGNIKWDEKDVLKEINK